MAANWVESGSSSEVDGDKAGRHRVTILSERRASVAGYGPGARLERQASAVIHYFGVHFSPEDQEVLADWALDTSHGYDRLHIERGVLEDGTWTSYALAYVPGQAWSTWGVMRRGDHIEVWRCATGKNSGRFMQMTDALASLPHAVDHRRTRPIAAGLRVGSRRRETR